MKIKRDFMELLFPPRCPLCDRLLTVSEIRGGGKIHEACRGRLYPLKQPYCMHCGRPLTDEEQEYCFDCTRRLKKLQNPRAGREPFSYIIQGKALFVYQGDIRQTMYRFKYSNRREYAGFLADEAYKKYGNWIKKNQIEAVIPVPMYKKKEKRRGYNQAKLFAKALGERLGLVYEPDAVKRLTDTKPQKKLNAEERKNNLKNAFHAEDFVVKYRCVLLVDDIYTTGVTAEAVAKELCRAGIDKIFFLSVCTGRGV